MICYCTADASEPRADEDAADDDGDGEPKVLSKKEKEKLKKEKDKVRTARNVTGSPVLTNVGRQRKRRKRPPRKRPRQFPTKRKVMIMWILSLVNQIMETHRVRELTMLRSRKRCS